MLAMSPQPPALPFVAVGGLILAAWAAFSTTLGGQLASVDSLTHFGVVLGLNVTALCLVLLVLGAVRSAVPEQAYRNLASHAGLLASLGAYTAAGLVGGMAREVVGQALFQEAGGIVTASSIANVASVVLVTLVFGMMANVYYTFIERLRSQQATLQLQVKELERSRRQITAAEENLRREIAELLHGRVQSRLVVAWHRLGQCENLIDADPDGARSLLAQVREEIDHIREHEVRQASHLLHPSIIQVGLLPAVRSLVQRFSSGFQVTLHVDPKLAELDDPADNKVAEPIRLMMYRVLEEALNNINRHAAASRVDVSLAAGSDKRLGIVIVDNGRGFDIAKLRPGLGLNAIAARIGQYGGMWQISSTMGRGTRLSAFLPLQPPVEEEDSHPQYDDDGAADLALAETAVAAEPASSRDASSTRLERRSVEPVHAAETVHLPRPVDKRLKARAS